MQTTECVQETYTKYIRNIHGVYMAVRKPLVKIKDKVDVDALIDVGAKVKEDHQERSKKVRMVNLKIPCQMLQQVDKAVQERIYITRTGWIMEAIYEKLKQESRVE